LLEVCRQGRGEGIHHVAHDIDDVGEFVVGRT
jgi:hypothetical protein